MAEHAAPEPRPLAREILPIPDPPTPKVSTFDA